MLKLDKLLAQVGQGRNTEPRAASAVDCRLSMHAGVCALCMCLHASAHLNVRGSVKTKHDTSQKTSQNKVLETRNYDASEHEETFDSHFNGHGGKSSWYGLPK